MKTTKTPLNQEEEGNMKRGLTRSRRIRWALDKVLRRLPASARTTVVGFLSRIVVSREWESPGLSGDIERSSALTCPLWSLSEPDMTKYECQIIFHLPMLRLFSDTALIGIIAHELAHVHEAARLGNGWHEKMQARYQANERDADRLARRWGFETEIARLHVERLKKVNPILDRRAPSIMRLIMMRSEELNRVASARWERRQAGQVLPTNQAS
jgi:hypothetical protein